MANDEREQQIALNMAGAMMLGAISDFTVGEEQEDLLRRQLAIICQIQRVLGLEPASIEAMVEAAKLLTDARGGQMFGGEENTDAS